jgi:hypothetical protein
VIHARSTLGRTPAQRRLSHAGVSDDEAETSLATDEGAVEQLVEASQLRTPAQHRAER